MRWRRPAGLLLLPPAHGTSLARLAALEGASRAVMVGVIPLAAFEALGDKQTVSYVFLIGAGLPTFVTVSIGWLEELLTRRWVVSLGVVCLVASTLIFMVADGFLFAGGVALRATQASIFSVCLSLYIMDFIGKAELPKTESKRMVYLAAVWMIGPIIGTALWDRVDRNAPFLLAALLAIAMLAYFWRLRLGDNKVLVEPKSPAVRPLRAIPRFFSQRYLRIAYIVVLNRAIFWATLFVYGPIYVIEAGLGPVVAGLFLSVAASMLFLSPLVVRLSERHGVRAVVIRAYVLIGASCLALAAVGDARPIGVVFWLTGAVGGGMVDVLGNIPFMRLVKPRERPEMTSVFSTWREASFLLSPLLAAIVLALGPFWVLYLVIAVFSFAAAVVCSYLPRRL